MPELSGSGGITVLPVHAFMARTGKTFNSIQIYQLTAQI